MHFAMGSNCLVSHQVLHHEQRQRCPMLTYALAEDESGIFCTLALGTGQLSLVCSPQDETSWFLKSERSPRAGLDTWGSMSCCTVACGSADGLEKLEMKNDSNQP